MTTTSPMKIGIIGAGMISDQYLTNLTAYPDTEVVMIADLDLQRAAAQARAYAVPLSGSPEDALSHPDIELIVNLTIPAAHAPVSLAAVQAGKHVWSEKPISVDFAAGEALLAEAAARHVRVGTAPDTVLGRGVQSARRAIAAGIIGTPVAANTAMQYTGPDIFHPNPEFLFAPGAGPVFDMGPYYLSTLVSIFGPIRAASAFGTTSRSIRKVKVGPRAGEEFPVLVPTHVSALLQFDDGAVSQSVFSWDSPLRRTGVVEIIGTEGTLAIPDPNMFQGELLVTRSPAEPGADNVWEPVAPSGIAGGRGLGIVEMIHAIREDRAHRASGELGLHVLEGLLAIDTSVSTGRTVTLETSVAIPEPIAETWNPINEAAGAV